VYIHPPYAKHVLLTRTCMLASYTHGFLLCTMYISKCTEPLPLAKIGNCRLCPEGLIPVIQRGLMPPHFLINSGAPKGMLHAARRGYHQRVLNNLLRARLSRGRMLWLYAHPLSRRHTGRLRKRGNFLPGDRGKGMGEEPNHTTARQTGPLYFIQYSLEFTVV
jgi:hypothetical protein